MYNTSLDEAKILLTHREFRKALLLYVEMVRTLPGDFTALHGTAQCYLGLKDYAQALPYAKQALEINPKSGTARVTLAYIYLNQNDLENSRNEANLALELEPESSEALECLGTVLMKQKQVSASMSILEKVLEKNPNSAIAQSNLAYLYDSVGQPAKVVQLLKAMFHTRPTLRNGYFLLLAYLRQNVLLTIAIILLIVGVAYYFNIKLLLVITPFFAAQIVRRLVTATSRPG